MWSSGDKWNLWRCVCVCKEKIYDLIYFWKGLTWELCGEWTVLGLRCGRMEAGDPVRVFLSWTGMLYYTRIYTRRTGLHPEVSTPEFCGFILFYFLPDYWLCFLWSSIRPLKFFTERQICTTKEWKAGSFSAFRFLSCRYLMRFWVWGKCREIQNIICFQLMEPVWSLYLLQKVTWR